MRGIVPPAPLHVRSWVQAASLEELSATVIRMESRLSTSADPLVQHLLRVYVRLARRFEVELGESPRDIALAKASALMLIQGPTHAADGI